MDHRILFLASVISVSIFVEATHAQSLHFDRVASGLRRPVFGTAAPGDPNRLYIVDARSPGLTPANTANIRILDLTTNSLLPTPFLSIPNVSTGSEQGLLGLAFHPDYASNGRFFVNYTDAVGTTIVQEYNRSTASPSVADPASARPILSIAQPFNNHNGGWMDFGPDNHLYIATGDGGSGNDPFNNAQTITGSLLGKMLRINVNADDFLADPNRNYAIPANNPFVGRTGDDEIWSYGLRNPWRPSFDRLTGDLYIADVGQGAREEISVQPAGSSGGENYGWDVREGMVGNPVAGAIDPIFEYPRTVGQSITGGYVYRGPIPELQGHYFFADFVSNRIMSLRWDGSSPTSHNGQTSPTLSTGPVAGPRAPVPSADILVR